MLTRKQRYKNRLIKKVGASVANTMRLVSMLNESSSLIATIGNDETSSFWRETSFIYFDFNSLVSLPGKSAECLTISGENHKKIMMFSPGVSHQVSMEHIDQKALANDIVKRRI